MSSSYYGEYGYGVDLTRISIDANKFAEFVRKHDPKFIKNFELEEENNACIWEVVSECYEGDYSGYGVYAFIGDQIGKKLKTEIYSESDGIVDRANAGAAIFLPAALPWQLDCNYHDLVKETLERVFKETFAELGINDIAVDYVSVVKVG